MAQPSVANYFHTRKRNADGNPKLFRAQKVLKLDNNDTGVEIEIVKGAANGKLSENSVRNEALRHKLSLLEDNEYNSKVICLKANDGKTKPQTTTKKIIRAKPKKIKETVNQRDIQDVFLNMTKKETDVTKDMDSNLTDVTKDSDPTDLLRTPPSTPTKRENAMDKLNMNGTELSLKQIRQKLCRSSRLAELKASMSRFKEASAKLERIEEKTSKIPDSPSLKAFKSLQLEVTLSPQKHQSPDKAYLSPKKDTSARKNLLNLLSPSKNAISSLSGARKQLFSPEKPALTLPFKYRSLAEMFRSIDTVCQIMYNRKEAITFRKLKPGVEELLKKNLTPQHFAQIKSVCPDFFKFKQEKMRAFGMGTKHEQWELVVEPVLTTETMTSDCLLKRRRLLFNKLIDKVKTYHHEFLQTLDPPLMVSSDKITRWHPLFDIEKIPDVELAELPQPPTEEKFTTGKDVLEKARQMFNCNTRMEQALERLKAARENATEIPETPKEVTSVLKGVPKALLERVRQKQAAKALMSMTRSDDKDKELQMYRRLPEFARLIRNLFVAERKGVLALDVVVDKLGNSIRSFMTKPELEAHIKLLSKEFPGFIACTVIRNSTFVKVNKDADLSLVLGKLEKLIADKSNA